MIVAYAQASDRQGLDAAVNGRSVALEDATFADARDRSASLHLRGQPHRVGDVEVRHGLGILRLELLGSEADAESRSPIVVVIGGDELRADRGALVDRVVQTISALDRHCDQTSIEDAIGAGEGKFRVHRMWVMVGVAMAALTAVGLLAIWAARTPGASNV